MLTLKENRPPTSTLDSAAVESEFRRHCLEEHAQLVFPIPVCLSHLSGSAFLGRSLLWFKWVVSQVARRRAW